MESEEFDIYVMPYRDMIFRLAQGMLSDRSEAEDATQDILGKLWLRRDRLAGYDNLGAVVYTVARNHCIDLLRSRRTRPEHTSDVDRVGVRAADLMAGIERSDMKMLVGRIIAGLPERQRTVIRLRDVEGCGFDEISAAVGIDEGNVRVTLSRARKAVREQLIIIMNYGIERKQGD